jgi:hypothetical protein
VISEGKVKRAGGVTFQCDNIAVCHKSWGMAYPSMFESVCMVRLPVIH